MMLEVSEMSRRCSTRICGVHVHTLPAYEKAGYPSEARDVGERGEKKGASCPAITDVLPQSKLIRAVRMRTKPTVTPSSASGKPPKKANWMAAVVLAGTSSSTFLGASQAALDGV